MCICRGSPGSPCTFQVLLETVNGEVKERRVPITEVQGNAVVKVMAGDKVPVDGEVTWGTASVDESVISGEHIPVEKQV